MIFTLPGKSHMFLKVPLVHSSNFPLMMRTFPSLQTVNIHHSVSTVIFNFCCSIIPSRGGPGLGQVMVMSSQQSPNMWQDMSQKHWLAGARQSPLRQHLVHPASLQLAASAEWTMITVKGGGR